MKNIAFIAQGKTFFKSIGTLVYFANKAGIIPHLIVYKSRKGKSYDNITVDVVKRAISGSKQHKIIVVNTDDNIVDYLKENNIKNVVCQDAQHHYKFLCHKFRIFSIAVFTDTLHYATEFKGKTHAVPHKTYFLDERIRDKFEEIIGETWNSSTLGAPHFDHFLFTQKEKSFSSESVLFLAPPRKTLAPCTVDSIACLVAYCKHKNIDFIFKDRIKAPWHDAFLKDTKYITDELGFPYTSMYLLCNTSVHVTAYGTSAFESNFLGKPAINLPVKDVSNTGNYWVSQYNLEDVFNNDLCKNASDNLINDFENAMLRSGSIMRNITFDNNFSLDILSDIVKEIA